MTNLDVSKNTELDWLRCDWNQLTSLDVSNNTVLTLLNCSWNQLTSLDISNNTALSFCDCKRNVSGMIINIRGGQIIDSFLHDNSAVILEKGTSIPTGNISFEDSFFKAFCVENFDKNGDGEISYAEALCVIRLYVNTDNISSLKGIEFFINLKALDCSGSGWNSSLQKEIYGKLKSLDVSRNTALTDLSCSFNQLTNLDVSKNTALKNLQCDANQLTNLDVSKNKALIILRCYSNQLTNLDVSNNTALTQLDCHSNLLTSLDVSQNTALESLWCSNNPFLTEIWLKMNQSISDFNYDTSIATIKYK